MEIIELISYNINIYSKIIEVEFRVSTDTVNDPVNETEDDFRSDIIELNELNNFGFTDEDVIINYDDDLEPIEFNFEGYDLLSFLNEYYVVYPERMPKKSFL